MALLASVSESLNIWNCEDSAFSLKSSYRHAGYVFSAVSWNHTNQVVAIAGNYPSASLIQANNGQLLTNLQLSKSSDTVSRAISFSSNSKNLAIALNHEIQLWDMRKKEITYLLNDHRKSVVGVCFLPNGDLVSGDESGDVRYWDANRISSKVQLGAEEFGDLSTINISGISAQAGAGYANGFINIFDTSELKLTRRQKCHLGRLSSLSFSPKNPRLLTTAGSDGRLLLIDTASKVSSDPSASIELRERINSVCFHENAIHVAVGTNAGNIFMYDWRNNKTPLFSVNAQSGPITRVEFQASKLVTPTPASQTQTAPVKSAVGSASVSSSIETLQSMESKSRPAVPSPKPAVISSVELDKKTDAMRSMSLRETPDRPSSRGDATSVGMLKDSLRREIAPILNGTVPSSPSHMQPVNSLRSEKVVTPVSTKSANGSAKLPPPVAEVKVATPKPVEPDNVAVEVAEDSAEHDEAPATHKAATEESFSSLRNAMRPVTVHDLQEAMDMLRYEVHCEVREIIREQVRQFEYQKV